MKPKTICVIAPLPPKGNVAARHAGQIVYHLDKVGHNVWPSTTVGPAYCLDMLKFAPKRAYKADRDRLLALAPDMLVLYPEGLDFSQISQQYWWHRWLEGWRRLGLVWRLLWRSKQSLVVFRLRQLKKPDHLSIVALAGLVKIFRPFRVRLRQQKHRPEKILSPLLRTPMLAALPEQVELRNLEVAVKRGADGRVRLTPVWLRAAASRTAVTDALYGEINTLAEVVDAFGEATLPVLAHPAGYITAAPFEDPPAAPIQGVAFTRFMVHTHHAQRLAERFPLDTKDNAEAYKTWFNNQAPKVYRHALLGNTVEQIDSDLTPARLAHALHRIIANARYFGAEAGISTRLKSWLTTALPSGLTRLEFLLAVLAHAPLDQVKTLDKPWQATEFKGWFSQLAFGGYPALAGIAGLSTPTAHPAWLTTRNSANGTGLGQNQRMSEQALHGLSPKRSFCLHHVNADAIPSLMLQHHTPKTFHIGFLLWELETLPQAHALAGKVLDEVWAPSRYVQKIYQQAYSCPVTWVGKGFDLPPAAPFDLSRLGVQKGQPFFLLSFDLHSSVARKNPLAAVLAFQMAFEGNPDARLVIKTSKPLKKHWGDPERQMSIIEKLIARDKRIILFQEHLRFAEYLGLIKSATALVSPHRAEGFGYVPAYAMALGTPVIATDYAGAQDFCTAETALPIPWRKRNVRAQEAIYPLENAYWAEINHEALADAMQDVLSNPEEVSRKSAAGQALMQREYSLAALRARYKKRLRELDLI